MSAKGWYRRAAIILDGVKIVQIQYINFRGLFCYVMNADAI
jgi:hypothetical protein